MTLQVYNTLSRQKETFVPVDAHHVKMYVCGPTVYNLIHIGNARPAVIFDVVFRLLRQLYGKVSYVRNITDIDDKIINAAKEQGKPIEYISALYAEEYDRDMESLLNIEPSVKPYATEHIEDMITMVQTLIEKGKAYEAEGHVLFDVKAMDDYGGLSRCSLDDMLDGARVEVASYKKYAGDFVLWKPSDKADPGWDSPWGRGRPGWHLECSAMIEKHLGETIDIHGGGRDLIFPHHENEIAQSQCSHDGKLFVKYWMHNGYINIDGEKMSKSLGNFKTVRGLLESFPGEVIRYALLSAHYRSELDFSAQLLTQSKASLDSLYGALRKALKVDSSGCDIRNTKAFDHLLDDVNTPLALSELHALAKKINKLIADNTDPLGLARAKAELLCVGAQLGLLQQDPDAWFEGDMDEDANSIDQLVQERNQAKIDKNYARADEIRQQLTDMGIVLEDGPSGTQWRKQ